MLAVASCGGSSSFKGLQSGDDHKNGSESIQMSSSASNFMVDDALTSILKENQSVK